jgi:peptide/nickel transport system substrate-binding protein
MKNFRRFQRQHQLDKYLVSSLHPHRWPRWHQVKHLPLILNQRERRTAGMYTAVLIIGITGLFVSGYLGLTTATPQRGGEYSEALVGSPRFINPILAQTNDVDLDLSRLVFSGLMQYDAQRQLVPDLAESYAISDDGLTYTFVLRSSVTWHDGEPLKVDDILFTIASIQDPDFKSPLGRSFRGVVAERIDDRTVKLTLKEPFAPFLGLLTVGILPEHLWYAIPSLNASLAELNQKPVGTGPWRFDSSKKDSTGVYHSYTLARNAEYYGPQAYLDKLTFKFYPDTISAIDALKAKSVKGLAYLPGELTDELRQNKNLDYHQLAQHQYTAVFFNGNRNTLLKTAYVREALALATDKERIATEAFSGTGEVIDSPTLPGIAAPNDLKRYAHNPQAAAELLEKMAGS